MPRTRQPGGRSIVRVVRPATMALLAMALGCATPVAFVDDRPIEIAATPPPPAPETKPQRVEVKQDRIQINDKILFDFDKATIKPESHGLLDEVVAVIKKHPHIRKLSIEGHTDADGPESYNQGLSERRSAAVRAYLIQRGTTGQMLTSQGFGEARPLADNTSKEGKEKNRRVEFIITEQDELTKVYEVDPKTGQRREITPRPATATAEKAP